MLLFKNVFNKETEKTKKDTFYPNSKQEDDSTPVLPPGSSNPE